MKDMVETINEIANASKESALGSENIAEKITYVAQKTEEIEKLSRQSEEHSTELKKELKIFKL